MNNFMMIFNLACGQHLPEQEDCRARRLQLTVMALLGAMVLSGLWGMAAGSSSLSQALANVLKVPMVVLISSLVALPAGLLTWKLSGARMRGTDLVVSLAAGVFCGTAVMAVMAPVVALYYHSSAWAGPFLGMGSVWTAIAVGAVIFVRNALHRASAGARKRDVFFPVAVTAVMHLAVMMQLVALAAPILPELTVFDGGIDQLMSR